MQLEHAPVVFEAHVQAGSVVRPASHDDFPSIDLLHEAATARDRPGVMQIGSAVVGDAQQAQRPDRPPLMGR